MPYNDNQAKSGVLWAVVDNSGNILYSRGGSSSKPRLMVYDRECVAVAALKSPWIKQVFGATEVSVKMIYQAPTGAEGES